MFKITKKTALLSVIFIYGLQSCMLFSSSIIDIFQEIRYQKQITKNLLPSEKQITVEDWNKITNKKEIKIANTFYDVVSYKINSKKVHLQVVEDNLESTIRISFQNILNKQKNSESSKKKYSNTNNFVTIIEKINTYTFDNFTSQISKNSSFVVAKKANKITLLLDKPPC